MLKRWKQWRVNSDSRISGTHENFTYRIDVPPWATHVVVSHSNVPISYYNVRPLRDTFYISEDGGTNYTTITLPHGTYTFESLKNKIELLLNSNSPNGWTYSVSITDTTTNPETGKMTYSVSGNTSQPILKFLTSTSTLFELMGFNKEQEEYSFSNNSLITPSVCYMIPESVIYLHSDICDSSQQNDILATFYSGNNPAFSNIPYHGTDLIMNSVRLARTSQNVYNFYITDSSNNSIDLNDVNITFTLVLFELVHTFDKINDYIKYKLLNDNQN